MIESPQKVQKQFKKKIIEHLRHVIKNIDNDNYIPDSIDFQYKGLNPDSKMLEITVVVYQMDKKD